MLEWNGTLGLGAEKWELGRMTNMQCDQFERILEEQDQGALPEPVLAHLESCEACRALSADFGAIRDLARELGADEVAPPERIWVSLRNQLEAEGLIHEPQPAQQFGSRAWWTAFQRPAIAGTFLAMLLVAAAVVSFEWSSPLSVAHTQLPSPQQASAVPSADSVFKEEMLTVGNDSMPGFRRQDTAVTDSIRRNLQIVDNFIAMCEKDVHEQPDNQLAREYLYGAYQQKAELLATATNRSLSGGPQ
jgi:hypothetical protein